MIALFRNGKNIYLFCKIIKFCIYSLSDILERKSKKEKWNEI